MKKTKQKFPDRKIRTLFIDDQTYDFYKSIGDGCFSRGVRNLSSTLKVLVKEIPVDEKKANQTVENLQQLRQ